jgi:hypothetical protein
MSALEAYAQTVCGGRIFPVHISPNFFDVSDLFGKFDLASRHFLPHAAGLIDVLRIAQSNSELALVVLEGANRAPIESYLLPLLETAASGRDLRLFHQSAVSPDDAYRDMHQFQWPSNHLLSATVVEGATTLPISLEVWSRGVFIETDNDAPCLHTSPEISEIPSIRALSGVPEKQMGVLDVLLEAFPEYGPFKDLSERFISALSCFEPDKNKLERAFLESILLPLAISSTNDEEREETLARLNTLSTDSDALQFIARRITRRVT